MHFEERLNGGSRIKKRKERTSSQIKAIWHRQTEASFLVLPCYFPSRSGVLLLPVPVQPCSAVMRYQFHHEMCRPLFRRHAPLFLLVLGCSRPLVGIHFESSEVAQEISPTQPAAPSILRTSRTSAVSRPLCAPQVFLLVSHGRWASTCQVTNSTHWPPFKVVFFGSAT